MSSQSGAEMSSKLVVFEGPDAAGKSSIAEDVVREFSSRYGTEVLLDSYPGKRPGTLGELVYRFHHNSTEFGVGHVTPLALQSLHIAAHIDAIESKLRDRVLNGEVVILDRFWWSTWVYGQDAEVNEGALQALIDAEICAWNKVSPAVIYLIERGEPLRDDISLSKYRNLSVLYDRIAQSEMNKGQQVVRVRNDSKKHLAVRNVVRHLENIL